MDFANPMFPSLFGNFDRSSHLFGEAFKQFENDLNKEANMWADSFFPFLMMSPLASMIQPNPMPHLNNSKAFQKGGEQPRRDKYPHYYFNTAEKDPEIKDL